MLKVTAMLLTVGLSVFSKPFLSTPLKITGSLSRSFTDSQLEPVVIMSRLVPLTTVVLNLPMKTADRRKFLNDMVEVIPPLSSGWRSPRYFHTDSAIGRPVPGSIRMSPFLLRW